MMIGSVTPQGQSMNSQAVTFRSDLPRGAKADATQTREAVQEASEVKVATSEDERYRAIEQAAQTMTHDLFPIGDTRFTIYRDGSGEVITRFTNLRDGTVTYYPEQDMMEVAARQRVNLLGRVLAAKV